MGEDASGRLDHARGAQLAQRRQSAHDEVGKDRLVGPDRQDRVAQRDAAVGQHAHDHRLG